MPDDRPMPLTGEEQIDPHPLLGPPMDNFPSRRLPPLLIGWSFLIITSLLFNLATWNIDTTNYGPWIALGFGLVALGVGWWIMHLWNREVILYQMGFTYREGSKNVPFLYDELVGIRLRAEQLAYFGGLFRRRVYRITLRTQAGDVIQLNNIYRRVGQLGDELNQRVTDLQRPRVQEQVNSGAWVAFTPYLSLSQAGLRVAGTVLEGTTDDAVLPWARYGGYAIAQRQLNLYQADGALWFELPLAEVENLILLLEYLKHRQPNEDTPPS